MIKSMQRSVTTRIRVSGLDDASSNITSLSGLLLLLTFLHSALFPGIVYASASYACTYIRTVRAGGSGSSLMFSRWGCGPFDLLKNHYTDEKAKRQQVEPGEKGKSTSEISEGH